MHFQFEMFVFREIWRALFSYNTRFEIRPLTLLPTNLRPLFNPFMNNAEKRPKIVKNLVVLTPQDF